MKFFDSNGNVKTLRHPKKYLIDWDAKSRSKFQKNVKDFLRPFWEHDVVFEEFRLIGSRLSIDFYNANKKIAVEVQGAQHLKYVEHFHKDRFKYLDQIKRDQKKLDFCENNGIKMVEIYPKDKVNKELFARQDIFL